MECCRTSFGFFLDLSQWKLLWSKKVNLQTQCLQAATGTDEIAPSAPKITPLSLLVRALSSKLLACSGLTPPDQGPSISCSTNAAWCPNVGCTLSAGCLRCGKSRLSSKWKHLGPRKPANLAHSGSWRYFHQRTRCIGSRDSSWKNPRLPTCWIHLREIDWSARIPQCQNKKNKKKALQNDLLPLQPSHKNPQRP